MFSELPIASKSWQTIQEPVSGIYDTIFANGLKLLTLERPHLPIVTVMMWYRVGSAHTTPGKTGLAHLVEHLMFKGTASLPKGEIDAITQKVGGSNNAFTCADYTCYYFNFTADHWEKALEIEADRMVNCRWEAKEFASEKKVILEEIAYNQDSPYSFLLQESETAFFRKHPYRYPILGWKEDFEQITLEDAYDFYHSFYRPNNAVLVVVGDVKVQKVIAAVNKLFGNIMPGALPAFPQIKEEKWQQQRRLVLSRDVEIPKFTMLLPTCRAGCHDDYVLDLIDILLGSGKTSRFYRRFIVEENLAQSVNTTNDTRNHPGVFWLAGDLSPNVAPGQIEDIISEEFTRLRRQPVGASELEKIKNIYFSDFIFHQETNFDMAEKIGYFEIFGGYRQIATVPQIIKQISSADIKSIANKYFHPEHTLISWLMPEKKFAAIKRTQRQKASLRGLRAPYLQPRKLCFRYRPMARTCHDKLDVAHYQLDNGLRLLVLPNRNSPGVSLKLHILHPPGSDPIGKEGTGNLLGRLLVEGTERHSARQIAHSVEFIGASLTTGAGGVSARMLAVDFATVLALLSEIIRAPVLDYQAMRREKKKMLADLLILQDESAYHASRAFRQIVYQKHPYGRSAYGTRQSIAAIRRQDLLNYHRKYFLPNRSVLAVVGDIDADEVYRLAKNTFACWSPGHIDDARSTPVSLARKAISKYITMPKQQLLVLFGHIGICRNNPDYYKLLVLDQILGQGEGFTDRLSAKIRDELGLCYSIDCSISASAGIEPGTFLATLATSPENYHLAMTTLHHEIEQIKRHGVSEEELANAKAYLAGNFIFALEENDCLADHLIASVRYNLGDDYLSRFSKIIHKVTREDLCQVARKYLHPEVATTVVVGPVARVSKKERPQKQKIIC